MPKLKDWLQAARIRTLPLSVSGIIVGLSIANAYTYYTENNLECYGCISILKKPIFWLAILTTIGFQVISNFANDYGDGIKGTDNKSRVGPERALQSGKISPKQMKVAIILTSIITFIIALCLIYLAFGKENFLLSVIFIVLGISSIIAAIKYTVGKNAYGYSGFGDVFVFVFFGLVSVVGSYYLYLPYLDNFRIFLPAISIGLLSIAVLNLNNMRDIYSDKTSNKNTLVVKIGLQKAKIYHFTILIISFLALLIYLLIEINVYHISNKALIILNPYLFIFFHLIKVSKVKEPKDFDPELKKVALTTFLISILFLLFYSFNPY